MGGPYEKERPEIENPDIALVYWECVEDACFSGPYMCDCGHSKSMSISSDSCCCWKAVESRRGWEQSINTSGAFEGAGTITWGS